MKQQKQDIIIPRQNKKWILVRKVIWWNLQDMILYVQPESSSQSQEEKESGKISLSAITHHSHS